MAAPEPEGLPPFVPWSRLRPQVLELWEPGEHATILGPSGTGKSTAELDLLDGRIASRKDRGAIVFGTKPRDSTLTDWIRRNNAVVVEAWSEITYAARKNRKIVVWPTYGRASTATRRNKPVYIEAIDGIVNDGDWTVAIDETIYMVEQLSLRAYLDELWNAARSSGITVLAGAQRPSFINRAMTSNLQWLLAFTFTDDDDAKRIAEIGGNRRNWEAYENIPEQQFVIARVRTKKRFRSKIVLSKGVNNANESHRSRNYGRGGYRSVRGPGPDREH